MKEGELPPDILLASIMEVWDGRGRYIEILSPQERATYESFRIDKRRQDWLAGRIAAKRIVERQTGLPMNRIEIRVDQASSTRGRPYAAVAGRETILGILSLTHSGWLAAATFSPFPAGLDLELVVPREAGFESVAFSAEEQQAFSHLAGQARDLAVTRAWCMKEAVSKWIGSGLRAPFDELLLKEDPSIRVEQGIVRDGDGVFAWAGVWGLGPEQPRAQRDEKDRTARVRPESTA